MYLTYNFYIFSPSFLVFLSAQFSLLCNLSVLMCPHNGHRLFRETLNVHNHPGEEQKQFVSLFEMMLNIPVNSYGHVGTLLPFYRTFTQNEDVMTSN